MKLPIQHFVTACMLTVAGMTAQSNAVGTWIPVAATAPGQCGGGMILLSDGSVLCKSYSGGTDGIGNIWNKLTPDIHGSYANGTWSSIAPMINTRLYFSSQLLMDGRLYVAGGEYGTGGSAGEVYNPLTNTWTATPSPLGTVSDANSELMPDGRVMQALVTGTLKGTSIYNPTTNTFVAGPACKGIHNESAWLTLPDNSILFVDRLATASERYIPLRNSWYVDGVVPVSLFDAYGYETGGAVLLPNGKAFFVGSTGKTALYTPTGTESKGTWLAGASFPNSRGAPDAPVAMMPDGKVLCVASAIPTSANHFPSPSYFYEYDYVTNTFTAVNAPGGGASLANSTYVLSFINLPDGNILYGNQGSGQYYLYQPSGAPTAAGKPVISYYSQNGCGKYTLTGTQFNGISQGSSYGDDWQMNTNYPVIRLTSGTNVYYARTFNWNSCGVSTGSMVTTTNFTIPASVPAGTYSMVVTANGIASDAISFDYTPMRSADLDGDNVVDSSDMSLTLLDFGPCTNCAADIDMDNVVDSSDLSLVLLNEGACQ